MLLKTECTTIATNAITRKRVVVNAGNRGNPCGQGPMKLTASSGTVRSPGYDQSTYDNDAYCSWLIEAPAGNVRHTKIGHKSKWQCLDPRIPACFFKSRDLGIVVA